MNTLHILLSFLVVTLLFMGWITSRPRGSQMAAFANVGEGFWPGRKTYRADAAITTRYLLVKLGSDSAHVAVAGAADIPIGIATDEPGAAEDAVNVDLLGSAHGTKLGVASGAIPAGAFIVPDANGKVRALPGTTGTYYIIGRALSATSADGDPIQYDPIPTVQRVV